MAKSKILTIMCGAPGSGKSTWLRSNANNANSIVISRDQIRFEMVPEDEPYFSKEEDVFKTFIRQIQNAIDDETGPVHIYVDATHMTEAGRRKVLDRLKLDNVQLEAMVFRCSLDETLRRNALREGRALVPESAVINMYNSYEDPAEDEKYKFDVIYYEKYIGTRSVFIKYRKVGEE